MHAVFILALMDGLSKTVIFDWTSLAAYIPCTVIWIEAARDGSIRFAKTKNIHSTQL